MPDQIFERWLAGFGEVQSLGLPNAPHVSVAVDCRMVIAMAYVAGHNRRRIGDEELHVADLLPANSRVIRPGKD